MGFEAITQSAQGSLLVVIREPDVVLGTLIFSIYIFAFLLGTHQAVLRDYSRIFSW